ncbi:MAG: twin-arginine translocase subunit TatC [Peptococcaceae bacterium]|nr:twin-arginine translocase subunit TatC [Peptococcaceae bacterium]
MSENDVKNELNESLAPVMEHLDELRTRLVRCALALLLGMVVCFALFQQQLTEIVMGPFMALEQEMIYTQPAEGFMFQLKIALLGGVVMASPVIIWQIMRFILPALYSNEKRVFLLMTFFGILLFVGGVCFGYFLVLEPIMQTLIKLAGTDLTPMITANSYMSFVLGFLIPLGLVFEIPMVVYFLTIVGVITPDMLTKNRKYVLLVVLIIAAMLTPPDIVSQLCMAGPMLLLYEMGIQISKFVYKRKLKKEAKQAAKEARKQNG